MTILKMIDLITYAEPAACVIALVMMYRRRQMTHFKFLATFLAVTLAAICIEIPILALGGNYLTPVAAYRIYFYIYWIAFALEAMLGLGMVYDVYKLAMAPLRGLQTLGMLMFRWAAGIAIAVSVGMAFGPHVTGPRFIIKLVTQMQQTEGVITLCLLLFVCLAIRPMGLSYGSKIFGVSVGLGIIATADLVGSAWLMGNANMASTLNLLHGLAFCIAVSIWMTYFVMPEPRRRMIVLPTTSPFLRWNQIAAALGDAPGFVAPGGIDPEMLAPAEVEIMRRASLKMQPAQT